MQLAVTDGNGQQQIVIVAGIESAAASDGTITATGVSQMLLAANVNRSGWAVLAVGNADRDTTMWVQELGGVAAIGGANGSMPVAPGVLFPPPGFPLSTAQINITGNAGDTYIVREW